MSILGAKFFREVEGKELAIVGKGASLQYMWPCADFYWASNILGAALNKKGLNCTAIFWMDDLVEASLREDGAALLKEFNRYYKEDDYDAPLITSCYDQFVKMKYPYIPIGLFPLPLVVKHFGIDYFNNSMAYCLALAIMARPKTIHIHGCDFTTLDESRTYQKACFEFWCGVAAGRGIQLRINPASALLETSRRFSMYAGIENIKYYYGYEKQPRLSGGNHAVAYKPCNPTTLSPTIKDET